MASLPLRMFLSSRAISKTMSKSKETQRSPFPWSRATFDRSFFRPALDSHRLQAVSLLEMKKFLRSKAVDFEESVACVLIRIPKHVLSKRSPDLSWSAVDGALADVYINKITGTFVCPELSLCGEWKQLQSFLVAFCRSRGGSKHLREDLPDLPTFHVADPLRKRVLDALNDAKPIESFDAQQFKNILKQFNFSVRNSDLSPEDFAFHRVRVAKDADDNYELLFPVVYPFSGQTVGLKRVTFDAETRQTAEENFPSEHELSQSQDSNFRLFPFLYGCDICRRAPSDRVTVVSSVLDALQLTAKSRRQNLPVLALAEGITSLPPEHLPFLEPFKELTFWFPDDTLSADAVNAFSKKLGQKRCRFVNREFPQPSVFFAKKKSAAASSSAEEMLRLHSRPCSHEHITTFDVLREDVFLELAHCEEVEGVKFKRFEQMNEFLRGFRRGELTVFSGRTGSGKTTFMSEYSLDLCAQSVTTLWGSFEVRNVRLAKMQLKQFSGVNLEDQLERFDECADRFSKIPMYYLTFHGAQEIDKVLDAMGHAVYVYDIAHVIIDNLQFMMGSTNMRGMDRFYTQDVIVQKFRKFATLHNVHLTLVIHPRKEDDEKLTANSIFGGAKATQEADNVILLQEEEVNARLRRKYIQIVKNRFSGDLGVVPLFFNRGTSTFSKKIFARERQLAKQKASKQPKLDDDGLTPEDRSNGIG